MRREETAWRGLPALRYSKGGTSVVVVRERGAKIVSLRDAGGREWLSPGDGRGPASWGASFENAEMCGWDECAPSLDASATPAGVMIADHGDVWDRAWDLVDADRLGVDLTAVGARLERAIGIGADGVVTLSYRVVAGRAGAAVLWAAHPLFRLDVDDRIVVDAREPLWDVSARPAARLGENPQATLDRAMAAGEMAKYYTDPRERPRWARIERRGGGGLLLSWEGEAVRTLGVWRDRGGLAAEDVVAFEPSTGWYDSLERALTAGEVLHIGAFGSAAWTIAVAPIQA